MCHYWLIPIVSYFPFGTPYVPLLPDSHCLIFSHVGLYCHSINSGIQMCHYLPIDIIAYIPFGTPCVPLLAELHYLMYLVWRPPHMCHYWLIYMISYFPIGTHMCHYWRNYNIVYFPFGEPNVPVLADLHDIIFR